MKIRICKYGKWCFLLTKFMEIPLTNEEEVILTRIIVDLSEEDKVTDEDILHELIERAKCYESIEEIKRICRKTEYGVKQTSIRNKQAYIESYGFEKIKAVLST